MAVRLGVSQTVPGPSGPWQGVYDTTTAGDGPPNRLVDSRNTYFQDPTTADACYSRPGFPMLNNGAVVYSNATQFKGQSVFTHFGLDGLPINFVCFGGHLFRLDATLSIATDVTPVGVAIDGDRATRVSMTDMGGVMAVNDGVHRPWVASDLSNTPITGTYIDFDGAGTAWVAYGPPTVFGGAGFWVLTSVNGVACRLDIAWTEPNDWTTGYQQPDFDDRWTLEQTGTAPIFAVWGTNVALYYWRQRSIGSISGTVGIDLASTATHDAISTNVGIGSPWTLVQFGSSIYFGDTLGRPCRFNLGGAPEALWHQFKAVVESSTIGNPAATAVVSTAAFEATLNKYCTAIWSPDPAIEASPTEFYVFDAQTGVYDGIWSIGPTATGVSVDCLGTLVDNNGRATLVVLETRTSAGITSGYIWGMNGLAGAVDLIGTEDLVILTTEDDVELTTEGQPATWMDNGEVPLIAPTTDRLGYDADVLWLYDQATILTNNAAPIRVTVQTPNTAGTVEGTPTPLDSTDGIHRTVLGLNEVGRGAQVTVTPTTADEQWYLNLVRLKGVPSPAGIDDQ